MQEQPRKCPSRRLFHATTLPRGRWYLREPLVPRKRVLKVLDSKLESGAIAWVTGPPGLGKTVLALQWAHQLSFDVLYISTRPIDDLIEGNSLPPDEVGLALEHLLNTAISPGSATFIEDMSDHLQTFLQLSQGRPRTIILDDLERLDLKLLMKMQDFLVRGLAEAHGNRALIISRPMHSSAFEALHSVRPLITILPSMLDFDRDEVIDAHERGVFGTASEAEAITAWKSSQGWMFGILGSLAGHGGRTMDEGAFRSYILNEFLSVLPRSYLNMMVASAHLPWFHHEIWTRWFQYMDLPHAGIGSVLSQMPILANKDDPSRFEIAPIMRQCLIALGVIAASQEQVSDLVTIAVDWFAHNNHADIAGHIAQNNHLEERLLSSVRQISADLASREEWSKIREIVKHLPESSVLQYPDLTYWYMHSLVEIDAWAVMLHTHQRLRSNWTEHPDALVSGRTLLTSAWTDYMHGRAGKAIEHSEAAYHRLPISEHRDRAWAAGTASISHSLQGEVEEAQRWMSLANFDLSHVPSDSRWWHNNIGPLHKTWMASHGLLSESYEASIVVLRSQTGSNRVRYLIELAAIDTERLRFDSARKLLDEAETHLQETYAQSHYLRVARANLAMASGDFDLASDFLTVGVASGDRRLDQYSREAILRGHIEIQDGDSRSAEVFCRAVPVGEGRWPKYFGDSHPDLLMALINQHRGRNNDAIALAQATLLEARKRVHIRIAVRSSSVLAYIYHKLGHAQLRDRAVSEAISDAGSSGFQLAFRVFGNDVRELLSTSLPTVSEAPLPLVEQGYSAPLPDTLTEREMEVLTLVGQSYTNKQIAEELFISVSTVKNHLASVFEKLETRNRRSAVRVAKSLGIINP